MNGSDQRERLVGDQQEYAALTGFLAQANGFRFTVLGLFLAAAGFVLQQPAISMAFLVLILTVLLWGSELRTRAIGPPPSTKGVAGEPRTFRLSTVVSHTMMIDLIYLVIFVYCALVLCLGPEHFQFQPK